MGGVEARTQGAFVLNSSTGATEDAASRRSSAARQPQLYFAKPSLVLGRSQALFERCRDLLLELRLLVEERAEVLAGEDEEAKRRLGRHRRRPGPVLEERDLAEELTFSQRSDLGAVLRHGDLAVDDDEELAAGGALAGEGLPFLHFHVLGHLRKLAQLTAGEVGEEGAPSERIRLRVLREELHGENLHAEQRP